MQRHLHFGHRFVRAMMAILVELCLRTPILHSERSRNQGLGIASELFGNFYSDYCCFYAMIEVLLK